MDFIRKLKNRKGFTMVELLVVIAIIGILLAMILPGLAGSNKDTKGKSYAKEFYYKTQDFMSRRRVADDPTNSALTTALSNGHFIVYAQAEANGTIVETGIINYQDGGSYTASDRVNRTTINSSSAYSDSFKDLMSKFEGDLESYIADTSYNCTYYALVDSGFRVQAAYWTDATYDELISGNPTLDFTDNCINGNYYSCSYPVVLSEPGAQMFVY